MNQQILNQQQQQQQQMLNQQQQQQQFCLKWNSFGTNLASAFSNLYKSESLADVTLFCEGTTFRAHRLILAACSKRFAELFEAGAPGGANGNSSCCVILEATRGRHMAALLEFMYRGEVHVAQSELGGFLKAAESLQVKGLSIEHEKIAVAQSQQQQQSSHNNSSSASINNSSSATSMPQQHRLKHRLNTINNNNIQNAMNNNGGSGGGGSTSPEDFHYAQYMHLAAGFNTRYDQRLGSPYDSPRKLQLRSPTQQEMRCSVLRENKSPRSDHLTSPNTHNDDIITGHHSIDDANHGPSGEPSHRFIRDGLVDDRVKREQQGRGEGVSPAGGGGVGDHNIEDEGDDRMMADEDDQGYAEDLRVKMEITNDYSPPTNSISDSLSKSSRVASSTNHSPANLSTKLLSNSTTTDLLATGVWNASKLTGHKAGSVATADGKKLKCPYCERLYGYETNLRAHVRQRHQGIRVHCPFCTRTFTRNNTVRRHIAREHKAQQEAQQLAQRLGGH
ncbi:zinc finger protein chinmo [Ctenocephalides felis]|uniref:zinc finger protein chinmo n=1 Tax=Ctenocephalides felis TaxID=7515 RepID=UPI000E6E11F4|nr:zinc finger protein chinmo [Ctenocephalides felis]